MYTFCYPSTSKVYKSFNQRDNFFVGALQKVPLKSIELITTNSTSTGRMTSLSSAFCKCLKALFVMARNESDV